MHLHNIRTSLVCHARQMNAKLDRLLDLLKHYNAGVHKLRKENQALRDLLSYYSEQPEGIPAGLQTVLQQIDDITRASSSPSAINSPIVGTEHSALVGRYSLQGLTVTHVFVQWH